MIKRLFILILFVSSSTWATDLATNSNSMAPTLTVPPSLPATLNPVTAASAPATPESVTNPASIPPPSGQSDILQKAQALEQTIPLIREQVTETIQSVAEQEKRINEQISQLQMQNAQLSDQINYLSQQLNEAHQQLLQESHQEIQNSQKISLMKWVGSIFVISFILIILTLLGPKIKIKRKQQQPISHETIHEIHESSFEKTEPEQIEDFEKEYDFMNSREAIPVKLDLARAYLDMGEEDSAREILKSVLEQGDEQQRTEAQELLSSLRNS